jgi:thiol-disulfide isomerase/thioredoxin
MESMISKGPMTVILVFSPSCPHCHTYMPLWKKLERQARRKSNMITVRADIYDKTPMSEKKQVSSVPTVLFVDKDGQISEAEEPRNMSVMSNAIRTGSSETEAASNVMTASNTKLNAEVAAARSSNQRARVADTEISAARVSNQRDRVTDTEVAAARASNAEIASAARASTAQREAILPKSNPIAPILPGTRVSENPLRALPATPVSEASEPSVIQVGGNPWAAFLLAAQQAAPAAALLGAYAALPAKRSSGLGRPTRKHQKRRSRRS